MKAKALRPSRMWIVVERSWRARTIAGCGLGLGRSGGDESDRLYGVHFVACFFTRKVAREYVREVAHLWPGLEVREVIVSEKNDEGQ